jgi:hypothetical protein
MPVHILMIQNIAVQRLRQARITAVISDLDSP